MPQPGGPESERRAGEINIRISRRDFLKHAKYGGAVLGGAVTLAFLQRVFQAGEVQSQRLPTPTPVPPQPLSPAERAVLPQQLIEKIERERGVATPTPVETLKNWKKYEYGPRSMLADIQMSASAMIPEGWYGAEIPQGSYIWPAFRLTEEWFSPNGNWPEYFKTGKAWVEVGLTRYREFSVSREDYDPGRPVPRKSKVTTTSISGMFGSTQDVYYENENPVIRVRTFVAFLERTDRVLLIRYGSEVNRQKELEEVLKRIAQNLQFSIMPEYAMGRGRKIASITPRTVSGTEDWKTYHFFTRHKNPWESLKNPLLEIALLLPPQWQFAECDESTVSPCFLFGEDKSGRGLRQNVDTADTYGLAFLAESAGGVSLEKYPRDQVDDSVRSGRYKVLKEGKIQDTAIGKYRGKFQDFELEPGDKPREGDIPGWARIFNAPLVDGTDRRFIIVFGGRPIARRSELEGVWDKVIQSMDVRFYHRLE